MFWDKVAGVYDIFAKVINRKTHKKLCAVMEGLIQPTDEVLECACGTGLLTKVIVGKCKHLIATDFSEKMLKKARKNCSGYHNVEFRKGNILQLDYPAESFDVVVAANVIHLLDEPYKALEELDRVCRKGGRMIIPTYMNETDKGEMNAVSNAIGKAGADFKREFTLRSYQAFLEQAGYKKVEYTWCDGRVQCAAAVIQKSREP